MTSPSSWHGYPKIYALGHAAISGYGWGEVIIEEKIDGSQFSFGVIDGELMMRSRRVVFTDGVEVASLFQGASQWVRENRHRLTEGWTYRGEVVSRPKHNSLLYGRVPHGSIVLYDVAVGQEEYATRDVLEAEGSTLGLEVAPVLWRGILPGTGSERLALLDDLLKIAPLLGGKMIEGVVIKHVARDVFGHDGKPVMAKHVAEAFKEVHSVNWKKKNPSPGDVVQQLCDGYRSEARWVKAIQHLGDDLEGSPRDIGALVQEVQSDIREEDAEAIKEALFAYAWPKIKRACVSGLPEWYKRRLVEESP